MVAHDTGLSALEKMKVSENARKMVANEIINMIWNNAVEGVGEDSLDSWTEGGALFSDDYKGWDKLESPLTESDKTQAKWLADSLNESVTTLLCRLIGSGE